jgi:hypothetical protein
MKTHMLKEQDIGTETSRKYVDHLLLHTLDSMKTHRLINLSCNTNINIDQLRNVA